MADLIENIPHHEVVVLREAVSVEPGKVNSLTIADQPGCKMVLKAIDKDTGIDTHTAPGDIIICVLEGTGEVVVENEHNILEQGQSIVVTKGIPHSVYGITAFKMLLIVVKD